MLELLQPVSKVLAGGRRDSSLVRASLDDGTHSAGTPRHSGRLHHGLDGSVQRLPVQALALLRLAVPDDGLQDALYLTVLEAHLADAQVGDELLHLCHRHHGGRLGGQGLGVLLPALPQPVLQEPVIRKLD